MFRFKVTRLSAPRVVLPLHRKCAETAPSPCRFAAEASAGLAGRPYSLAWGECMGDSPPSQGESRCAQSHALRCGWLEWVDGWGRWHTVSAFFVVRGWSPSSPFGSKIARYGQQL